MQDNVGDRKFLLFGYGGIKNHGCEAIVRTSLSILKKHVDASHITAMLQTNSFNGEQASDTGVDTLLHKQQMKKFSLRYLYSGACAVLFKNTTPYFDFQYLQLNSELENNHPICLSIGGDNYCYNMHNSLYYLDKKIDSMGLIRSLWGCSIEPDTLEDKQLRKDLSGFSLITARETITYHALLEHGINRNTALCPDPAFVLEPIYKKLPKGFIEGKTIGLNISNRVMDRTGVLFDGCIELIVDIIKNTDFNVALIPHVVIDGSNDLMLLNDLYEKFRDSGRVVLIQDMDCASLKGFIARCKMFIAARTHASIAAYSTGVPTLVIGYSVKSRGIAKDIFGTDEGYVLPYNRIKNKNDLKKNVKHILDKTEMIRNHLEKSMPDYIKQAWNAGNELHHVIEENT